MKRNLTYGAVTAATVALFALANACGGDETSNLSSNDDDGSGTNSGGAGQGGGQGGTGNTSDGGGFAIGAGGNTSGAGGSCVDIDLEATAVQAPSDIIFVIDNSGSMSEEISSVEANIDTNFAQIISASGIDYQVIMVTNHGTGSYDVCIGQPLSNTTNCNGPPVEIPGQFAHYDVDVQSHDSLCIILDTLFGVNGGGEADENGAHPGGWVQQLRQEAVKTFVEITDDGISCTWNGTNFNDSDQVQAGQDVATAWDQQLLGLAPFQFGTVQDRNYLFYSIVGLPPKANPLDPYGPFEPVTAQDCGSGCVAPGTGYQWLSKGTGALRFPVSQYSSYDAVFNDIALGVVEGSQIPCEVQLPDDVEDLNYDTLIVTYTPGGGGASQEWNQVASAGACTGPDEFYVDETTNILTLCPDACMVVESDTGEAAIDVTAQCVGIAE